MIVVRANIMSYSDRDPRRDLRVARIVVDLTELISRIAAVWRYALNWWCN